jgi:hypothetical protein
MDEAWEPTRATLHAYAKVVGAVARAHAVFHPKWWHVSLKVRPNGLVTDNLPLPGGGSLALRMDLVNDAVVLEASDGSVTSIAMTDGLTGTEFAGALFAAVADYGLEGPYMREKYEDDTPRDYDPQAATQLMAVLVNANTMFERRWATLGDSVGPIQLWPHGFDIAFEWYGSRVEEYEEDDEVQAHPAQLNFGLYPGGRAYFYSNPWPFESDQLVRTELPHGAEWHTEGWEGSVLYYDQVAGDPDGETKVLEYAAAVMNAARPTLEA